MRSLLPFLLFLLALPAGPAFQAPQPVTELAVDYTFGESITISGRIDPALEYETISLVLDFSADDRSLSLPLAIGADRQFSVTHRIADRFVQAFSPVEYWFVVEAPGGAVQSSEPASFFYADNRFAWRSIEDTPFRVHWVEGDAAFAQQMIDAAQSARARAGQLLSVDLAQSVDLYVYARLADYQFSRGQLGPAWAGGHTDPASGLVLLAIAPGEEAALEMEREIPHEVAHLVLHAAAGDGYWNLPAWLNEGIASVLETFPNPDYEFLVAEAIGQGQLLPLESLCAGFPQEDAGALLAYAQSAALVRYIQDVYGPAGLRALVESYAGGASCSRGPLVEPIGLDLTALEAAWRESEASGEVGGPAPGGMDAGAVLPWLVILGVVLIGPALVLVGAGVRKGARRA